MFMCSTSLMLVVSKRSNTFKPKKMLYNPIDEEKEDTNGPKHWSIVDRDELNQQLANRVTCSFCQSQGVDCEEIARTEIDHLFKNLVLPILTYGYFFSCLCNPCKFLSVFVYL